MTSRARFAEVAALAGDPARAGMLYALMDGRALTATELANAADVTPQTASGHLARLSSAGLTQVEKQGRHRYHRLASPAVAHMIESIMQVAAGTTTLRHAPVTGPRDAALRKARTCYDHLAGELGVALADALVARHYVELGHEAGLVTDLGIAFLDSIGISVDAITSKPRHTRVLCRPCLDWSERRPHIAGALGAALHALSIRSEWIRRIEGTRSVQVTHAGQRFFRDALGIALIGPARSPAS